MAGEKSLRPERTECMGNHGMGGLDRQALPPVLCPEMKANLHNPLLGPIWPQSTATDVRNRLAQEYGPVLQAMVALQSDLRFESLANLIVAERTTDDFRDPRIAPQRHGQGKIVLAPRSEIKASRWGRNFLFLVQRHARSMPPASELSNRRGTPGSSITR